MESLRQNDKKFGLINLLRQREIHERCNYTLPQKLHVTENFISRLGLEAELAGHSGCVNCLDWNETGEILASSSDDLKLCLWDPFRRELKSEHRTGHDGNVFAVKFMPKSNDRILVTGAGDNCVIAHDISVPGTIFHCRCHAGRVKKIACENSPNLFWSGSEDGTVMQYDLRTNHYCKPSRGDNYRVLVDLVNHAGRKAEVKCLAVNQMRPELIAVGANDQYVRLYDRRMIKLGKVTETAPTLGEWARLSPETAGKGDPDNNIPIPCAQYFIPGHLRSITRDALKSYAATNVTFSSDGNELLVNMAGEQIYLFDINKDEELKNYQFNDYVPKMSFPNSNCTIQKGLSNGTIFGHRYYPAGIDPIDMTDDELIKSAYGFDMNTFNLSSMNIDKLPDNIELLKQEANCKFQENQYALAISIYNKALLNCPNSAVLYANRAAAFMKRKWDGDIYAALRDCQTTLILDPNHVKAHFRLARCLHDTSRPIEAKKVLDDFNDKFPDYSNNSSHRALRMDIKQIMSSNVRRRSSSSTLPYHSLISSHEMHWRESPIDYKLRYCGHCNTTTDIKEASFFGNNGQYIVAGSDDGSFFIWDRYTTNIVRILRGDERIVNCLQPHPLTCLLATSGIDPVIRLWGPLPEDGKENEREVSNLYEAAKANQDRMNSDPFEQMMMSMGYHLPGQYIVSVGDDSEDGDDARTINPAGCRSS